jgi:hypothetical protein
MTVACLIGGGGSVTVVALLVIGVVAVVGLLVL